MVHITISYFSPVSFCVNIKPNSYIQFFIRFIFNLKYIGTNYFNL